MDAQVPQIIPSGRNSLSLTSRGLFAFLCLCVAISSLLFIREKNEHRTLHGLAATLCFLLLVAVFTFPTTLFSTRILLAVLLLLAAVPSLFSTFNEPHRDYLSRWTGFAIVVASSVALVLLLVWAAISRDVTSDASEGLEKGRDEVRDVLKKWVGSDVNQIISANWSLSISKYNKWSREHVNEERKGEVHFNIESHGVYDEKQAQIATLGVMLPFEPSSQDGHAFFESVLACLKTNSFRFKNKRQIKIKEGSVATCIRDEAIEQAKTGYTPSMFIIPSQLNGCEFPNFEDVVTRVAAYEHDRTGGPIAQLACHPGLAQVILELGAIYEGDEYGRWNARDGFHAFRKYSDAMKKDGFFEVVNGYLKIEEGASPEKFASLLSECGILIADDAEVCGMQPEYYKNEANVKEYHFLSSNSNTSLGRVCLAYASAAPVDKYLNKIDTERDSRVEILRNQQTCSTLLITAQYLAALRYASKTSTKRKVFVMPLGGKSFNNKSEDIFKALCLAVDALTQEEWIKLDVYFLTFERNREEVNTFKNLAKEHNLEIGKPQSE